MPIINSPLLLRQRLKTQQFLMAVLRYPTQLMTCTGTSLHFRVKMVDIILVFHHLSTPLTNRKEFIGRRSISGGEKHRVSIACELVTSPSILFLDEPTSGLDAYNAYNVVESLVSLARNYNRTVVFTIHQPRSNVVALFDQLVLLAAGRLVYSGNFTKCQGYFTSIGQPCPPGFNIADFLSQSLEFFLFTC
jgi:ABC-type multidrug transport system ATPase subunit